MSIKDIDLQVKQGQDDFIKNLREIEKRELDEELEEYLKREKRIYNICGCFYLIGSLAILLGWYAHYNYDFNLLNTKN